LKKGIREVNRALKLVKKSLWQYLGLVLVALLFYAAIAWGQNMLDMVDLDSPNMAEAEMSRAELLDLIASSAPERADLSDRRLSGLDLSGIDFRGADLRWSRLNNSNLQGANLRGVNLDLAWLIGANLQQADLSGAHLFSTQIQRANLQGARLDQARITANLSNSNLRGASFRDANMSADMKNQSMGLTGTVMKSADATEADFTGANMSHVNAEFALFSDTIMLSCNLANAKLGGADFSGAAVEGMILTNADLAATRLLQLKGKSGIIGIDHARNAARAITD
jgi:uncharacterized protein YjbI with pentapeptide repeats